MRFDAGNWAEYLAANIYFALQDDSIRDDLIKNLTPLLP
jgi:UTP--glucose-1-phosphate uridylyltransferase